jgi:hypothetical protein
MFYQSVMYKAAFLNFHNKYWLICRIFPYHILSHGGGTVEPPQTVSTTPKQQSVTKINIVLTLS